MLHGCRYCIHRICMSAGVILALRCFKIVHLQGSTLSFAELDARANQLAHRLIELGAAPERPVGILMRRSLDMFTGLLAILKAGSAYVPMDPDYPPDRLAIMAGDSKVNTYDSSFSLWHPDVAHSLDAS